MRCPECIAGISSDLYARGAELPGITVSSMPATGYPAEISRQKYGYRVDRRRAGLLNLN